MRVRASYIAEIDEIRINPMISKKGYLSFLEEKSVGWVKRFVVTKTKIKLLILLELTLFCILRL
jgi:hypothetical protein